MNDSLRALVDLMIELERRSPRVVTFYEYPSDVARWLHERGVRVNGIEQPYMLQDPCQYRPGWEIYKRIAKGHLWPK